MDIVDYSNHRICCFDRAGQLKSTIGGIGQQENDLYNPVGIYGKGNLLFILNREGQELKIFERNGKFLASFGLGDSYFGACSLVVSETEIIIPVPKWKKEIEPMDAQPLLSVFDYSGRKIREIGKTIPCRTAFSNWIFNSAYLHLSGKTLYGAFRNLPIIFAYNLSGKEIYFRDLRITGYPEIAKLLDRGREIQADSPDHVADERGIRAVVFSRGIACLDDQLYYAMQGGGILIFDKSGDVIGRRYLSSDEKMINLDFFQIVSGKKIYGLGRHPQTKSQVLFKTR
ncbi:MAG: hypothetical protein IMZ61_14830 [Planctomycetes bacterium]|nr:hypothetical protein [Planctomycetota bacterium]